MAKIPIAAGLMRWRFRFERRGLDENDERLGPWGDDAVVLSALMTPFRGGGEAVAGARLQGREPVVLTIRDCAAARMITTDWRAVDQRTGDVFGVKRASGNLDDIAYIDVLAQAEGTTGG